MSSPSSEFDARHANAAGSINRADNLLGKSRMRVSGRIRHIAGTRWPTKRCLNMQLLRQRNAMIA
jgi:hypothetical protein